MKETYTPSELEELGIRHTYPQTLEEYIASNGLGRAPRSEGLFRLLLARKATPQRLRTEIEKRLEAIKERQV